MPDRSSYYWDHRGGADARRQDRKTDDRLLDVAIHFYDHEDLESINDVSKTFLDQLEEQGGKQFKVTDRRLKERKQIS